MQARSRATVVPCQGAVRPGLKTQIPACKDSVSFRNLPLLQSSAAGGTKPPLPIPRQLPAGTDDGRVAWTPWNRYRQISLPVPKQENLRTPWRATATRVGCRLRWGATAQLTLRLLYSLGLNSALAAGQCARSCLQIRIN